MFPELSENQSRKLLYSMNWKIINLIKDWSRWNWYYVKKEQ